MKLIKPIPPFFFLQKEAFKDPPLKKKSQIQGRKSLLEGQKARALLTHDKPTNGRTHPIYPVKSGSVAHVASVVPVAPYSLAPWIGMPAIPLWLILPFEGLIFLGSGPEGDDVL